MADFVVSSASSIRRGGMVHALAAADTVDDKYGEEKWHDKVGRGWGTSELPYVVFISGDHTIT